MIIPAQISEEMRRQLDEAWSHNREIRFRPLTGSAAAFLALELRRVLHRPVVLVTESLNSLDELYRSLTALAGAAEPPWRYYPAWETFPGQGRRPYPELVGDRLSTLMALPEAREPAGLVTCVQALLQPALAPAVFQAHTVRLAVNQPHDPAILVKQLERMGYDFAPEVQARGQAAWRGGLLDVWPATAAAPCRLEFFGDKVETIRTFDPADQRSGSRLEAAVIPPASDWQLMDQEAAARVPLINCLPADALYFWFENPGGDQPPTARPAAGIPAHAAACEEMAREERRSDWIISWQTIRERLAQNPQTRQALSGWSPEWPEGAATLDLGFRALMDLAAPRRNILTPDVFEEQRRQWLDRMEERARAGLQVHLFFSAPGARDRFKELHPETRFHLHAGTLADGFVNESLRLAVLAEAHATGQPKIRRGRYERSRIRAPAHRQFAGEAITDWTQIEPGDLVVHLDHGIGRYLGLYEIEFNGKLQEALAVEYADKAKLYVPVSQTHLLSRYVGAGKHHAQLHRLGSPRWSREKNSAEQAVRDLAATLLEIQARRESMDGFAFPPDAPWQHEFEAAFPYEETEDQEQAIRAVKQDLESSRPMDRLVCGDVGYGKTEVALRAAFKVVLAGKQAAVLVPTTVLAQQHYDVFVERLSAYPVRIELLCRFRTPAEQAAVVRGLAAGVVDVVIGTHRLLQADIQFKDLGLVVIDEEQRFGVAHKERFKHLKQLVDVLTLTATPIPRTLYLSLTGARDISMIQTPPKARLAVETCAVKNEDHIVREAILRELNRGGQVYYLHNRVYSIERVRERLARLVPEARIAVGHGQMPTTELARVMRQFGRGEYDLLLCTTIIESGVDIPNVNTILIDRADRFGMADLYQLRGRVGRAARKAYAYLLLPVHGHLLDTSRKRLHAILEHADLGAGFRLALRDLEIRGAGNILGREQSGHIAAVGFELYCQLLRQTVDRLKRGPAAPGAAPEPAPIRIVDVAVNLDFVDLSVRADAASSAFLPVAYVEDERLRISLYRKIAAAASLADIRRLREEFQDRFGPVPAPLDRLLKIAALRIVAAEKGVTAIESREDKIMLRQKGEYLQVGDQFPRLRAKTSDGRLDELMRWVRRVGEGGWAEK